MWKQLNHTPGLESYEINEYGEIRDIKTKIPKWTSILHGYPIVCCNYRQRPNGSWTRDELKIHRLVAEYFIGPIPEGYIVHHKDRDKSNPYYTNLQICSRPEHMRIHADEDGSIYAAHAAPKVPSTPAKHGEVVLTEDVVHDICKLLMDGYSFPAIRDTLGLYNITDDCIGKIAQGKNWSNIRSLYDIPITKRDCMNSFSKYALRIAIMKKKGMGIPEIADAIHFKIRSKKDYDRLAKCSRRYYIWLKEGRWDFDVHVGNTKISCNAYL